MLDMVCSRWGITRTSVVGTEVKSAMHTCAHAYRVNGSGRMRPRNHPSLRQRGRTSVDQLPLLFPTRSTIFNVEDRPYAPSSTMLHPAWGAMHTRRRPFVALEGFYT